MSFDRRTSLEELHQLLWEETDRLGRVKVNQIEWGEKLGIHNSNVSRALALLVEENKIRKIAFKERGIALYLVSDPEGPPLRQR